MKPFRMGTGLSVSQTKGESYGWIYEIPGSTGKHARVLYS